MDNIRTYVILEPHIDDFELGTLPFILKNSGVYKNEHTPVAIVSVITFCTGRDEKDRINRFKKREKTVQVNGENLLLV